MTYKKLTQKFALILFIMILFVVVTLISYDPLHLYHKSWFSKESRLHGNMRLQSAGIINNYTFDSMIVGTSVLKCTSSLYASEKLGGTFTNLSADASNLYERNLIMKHALRKKHIKNIIYSFDTGLDANLKKNNRSLPLDKFDYLYDANPFNDLYAYWNNKFLTCASTFSKSSECIGGNRGLVRPKKWFKSIHKQNKEISGIESWVGKDGRGRNVYSRIRKQQKKPLTKEQYEKALKDTYSIIDTQLIDTIETNIDTSFHVVFPPYSRLQYALWAKYNPLKYILYKKTIKYLVEASQLHDNMYVYLLDDLDYLDNLSNYRDMRHYNTEMNDKIVDYVHQEKYIRTDDALDVLLNEIDLKNKSYTNLDDDIEKIFDAYKFRYNVTLKNNATSTTIKGWALSYKVANVELHLNGKKIKSMHLRKREDIFKKYPAYKQLRSGFVFKNVKIKSKKDKLSLIFKNKSRVIKKISIKNEQGNIHEKY